MTKFTKNCSPLNKLGQNSVTNHNTTIKKASIKFIAIPVDKNF